MYVSASTQEIAGIMLFFAKSIIPWHLLSPLAAPGKM